MTVKFQTEKIIAMFVLFVLTLVVSYIPIFVKSLRNSPKALSLGNAFAGGIFICTALIHILPDSQDRYEDFLEDDPKNDNEEAEDDDVFPVVNGIVLGCFSLILLIDRLFLARTKRGSSQNQDLTVNFNETNSHYQNEDSKDLVGVF